MRYLILLLALVSCAAGGGQGWQNTTLYLQFENGICSGTAVAADVVLTATHCLKGDRLVAIDGREAYALRVEHDGQDHTLVKVTARFKSWATIGPALKVADRVRWIGAPGGNPNVYREGYVSRVTKDEILVDGQLWKGDSGAGLFNARGELVGVISSMLSLGNTFVMVGIQPLRFTAKQWKTMA